MNKDSHEATNKELDATTAELKRHRHDINRMLALVDMPGSGGVADLVMIFGRLKDISNGKKLTEGDFQYLKMFDLYFLNEILESQGKKK